MEIVIASAPPPGLENQLRSWMTQYPRSRQLFAEGAPLATIFRYCGLALWSDKRFNEATSALSTATRLAPNEPTNLAELGGALRAAGKLADARDVLVASLALDRDQLQTWLILAGVENEIGDKAAAENAFLEALRIDASSAEALTGLGLLHFELRRFRSSADLLSRALSESVVSMAIYACLGQALYLLGDFLPASIALEKAAQACPHETLIIQKFARARMIATLIDNSAKQAIEVYRSIAGDRAEDITIVCREAFQALIGFGRREAAVRLGRMLLEQDPDDPIISYHFEVLVGHVHSRAPSRYLKASFDSYAPRFDKHLVENLKYNVPATCCALLTETHERFSNVLDLGCGTGLAAKYLVSFGDNLIGVDISPGMLEKAKERGLYQHLVQSEAIEYLTNCDRQFELIIALDVLVYFGDLAQLFESVGKRLLPGGIFALSFETGNHDGYELLSSGRFSHNPAYIEVLSTEAFSPLTSVPTTIRLEANIPVEGFVVLLRRS
ncbi:methyltransferase domain-containing protein [Methylocapsa polymorpha]|uniref:Methyltransferase domain-containing protein n=1 Tax=Methylocapsa polymorpha TaxID=3080828 RepID=A0ABZ0HSX1_9HYPH|nr:methyltransferase domain-containing protein [Methylocapsa sp. RX1]